MLTIKQIEKPAKSVNFSEIQIGEFFVRAGSLALKISTDNSTDNIFWIGTTSISGLDREDSVYRIDGIFDYWLV